METNLTVTRPTLDVPQVPPQAQAARRGWRWPVVLPLALAAAIAVTLVAHSLTAAKAKPTVGVRAVPVVAATVRQGSMAVNLSGLGTVVPTDSVTLHTRVDGQIMSVNFKEGQMVRKDDLLVLVDPRPYQVQLHQAEGQLAKDQAALKDARLDLERYKSLVAQGIIPQQQLDTQQSSADQFEAAIKSDQASVESAKLNLVYCHITAPVSGKVGVRLVDPGNMVHATDTNGLATITPVAPIDVLFTIPADSIQHVLASSRGGKALPVDAYDRDFTKKLATGILVAVDNQVDTTTGTVRLRAEFPNKDGMLFPNQFVNAKMQTDTIPDALIMPAAAVQRSPQGNYVYVVRNDTVDLHPVEILVTEGDQVAVKSGVASGDRVVVEGLDKLRPGSKVAATDAAAKP